MPPELLTNRREILLHCAKVAVTVGTEVLLSCIVVQLAAQLFLEHSQRAYLLLLEDLAIAILCAGFAWFHQSHAHRQECLINAYLLSKRARDFSDSMSA